MQKDVVVIGAGVAGLLLAQKLSALGFSVALIERNEQLAPGPSTRNEGWLHRGTYHSTSIKDRQTAIQVARRCIYGHEQLKAYAPESVEDTDIPAFALIKSGDRVTEVVSRWEEAGVDFRPIKLPTFKHLVPEAKSADVAAAFEVKDLGINTRILYRRLLTDSERAGVQVFTKSDLVFESDQRAVLNTSGSTSYHIKAQLFVFTSGYSIKEVFQSHFGLTIPVRYWKSHLLVFPRLARHSVFYVDPGEAATMNHGSTTVVGLNEDACVCDNPSMDIIIPNRDNILAAVNRLFRGVSNNDYHAVACIKTDVSEAINMMRSLNVNIFEPRHNCICALPGKMTEAPYLIDVLVQLICDRISDDRIALRPLDLWIKQGSNLVKK